MQLRNNAEDVAATEGEARRLRANAQKSQQIQGSPAGDGEGTNTDLTLSPDTPAPGRPATPLSPLSETGSPRSPFRAGSPFARRSPRLPFSPKHSPRNFSPRSPFAPRVRYQDQEDEYVDNVAGLVEGYNNSEQYRIMEAEAEQLEQHEQPREFYDGIRQGNAQH